MVWAGQKRRRRSARCRWRRKPHERGRRVLWRGVQLAPESSRRGKSSSCRRRRGAWWRRRRMPPRSGCDLLLAQHPDSLPESVEGSDRARRTHSNRHDQLWCHQQGRRLCLPTPTALARRPDSLPDRSKYVQLSTEGSGNELGAVGGGCHRAPTPSALARRPTRPRIGSRSLNLSTADGGEELGAAGGGCHPRSQARSSRMVSIGLATSCCCPFLLEINPAVHLRRTPATPRHSPAFTFPGTPIVVSKARGHCVAGLRLRKLCCTADLELVAGGTRHELRCCPTASSWRCCATPTAPDASCAVPTAPFADLVDVTAPVPTFAVVIHPICL